MPLIEKRKLLDKLQQETQRSLAGQWFRTQARASQRPPPGQWSIWTLLAGRGFGKTRVLVEWASLQAALHPGSRGAIVTATAADGRDVIAEGPAGFEATSDPNFKPVYHSSTRSIHWPNGSRATFFSAEEPNRLRGPQHHWAICDEFAAWKNPEAFDQLMFGLRLGQDPRVVIATTPRPTKAVKELLAQPGLIVTRGTTYENLDNLAPAFRQQIIGRYEGTRLGRQELNAEILTDTAGSLWKMTQIDNDRVSPTIERIYKRIVVGVDPKASATADSKTGIVVCGLGQRDGHGYVLADYSINGTPEQWAKQVAQAYEDYQADRIIVENNMGGDMVTSVLQATGIRLPVKEVSASRSKQARAEPISALYEQHKVHHVGALPGLEDLLTTWIPGEGDSPDELDAMVWSLWELMLATQHQRPRVREY